MLSLRSPLNDTPSQGVGEIDAAQVQAPPEKGKVGYYIIKSGDNLSKISKQFYGDPNKYNRIFEANREVI